MEGSLFEGIGKLVILAGIFLVVMGLLLVFWQRIPFLGKLPGDFLLQREGVTFFFPLVTSLIISLVLTVIANIIIRFWWK